MTDIFKTIEELKGYTQRDIIFMYEDYERAMKENELLQSELDKLKANRNEPLSLNELKQMDGKPVFCVDGEGHTAWCIVNAENEDCIDCDAGAWCFAFYAMTHHSDSKSLHSMGWLAYLNEPESEGE